MAASGRRGARRLLVQALYQHQLSGDGVEALLAQFGRQAETAGADVAYLTALLPQILGDLAGLDAQIAAQADRPVSQLDPVERGILWLGTAELAMRPEVPPRVVINEAVELCKEFGAQDSHRYVNAVLDRLAAKLR